MRHRIWPMAAALLAALAACRPGAPTLRITLTDGRALVARVIDAAPDALVVRTGDGQDLRIPRDAIRSLDDQAEAGAAGAGSAVPASGGTSPQDPRSPDAATQAPVARWPPGQEPIPPSPGAPAPSLGASGPSPGAAAPVSERGTAPASSSGAGTQSVPTASRAAAPGAPAPGTLVSIPAGTRFRVKLETPLSTGTSAVNDVVRGRLVHALGAQGLDLFPREAVVTGTVVESIRAGRVRDVASLSIVFRTIAPAAGPPLAVRVGTVTRQARSEAAKDAATVGGSAAAGSVVGGVVGGRKGAAAGAAAGAGAGAVVVLATRGRDVTLPAGTIVDASLLAPLTLSLTPELASALGQEPR